jgi:hypothetical protein
LAAYPPSGIEPATQHGERASAGMAMAPRHASPGRDEVADVGVLFANGRAWCAPARHLVSSTVALYTCESKAFRLEITAPIHRNVGSFPTTTPSAQTSKSGKIMGRRFHGGHPPTGVTSLRIRRIIRAATVICSLFVVAASPVLAKRKDDIVIMRNGDHLTGEIKRLDRGQLYFSPSYTDYDVVLNWAQVERLESKDTFNVSLSSGQIHTGIIREQAQSQGSEFTISSGAVMVRVSPREVVAFRPVEDSAWDQLTGSIDYGFSFTGGSNSTQSSLSGDVGYRAERWSVQANGSSVFNRQSGAVASGRNVLSGLYTKALTERWYTGIVGGLLNSRQQELTLRATAGGGLGRFLFMTDRSRLAILSGMLFAREDYSLESGENPQVNNAEVLFQLEYQMYRFNKAQLEARSYVFPSLTALGRVRLGAESSLKFDLVRNLYWKFSIYENFDSRPPVPAPRNDFGASTSIGWSF